MKPDKSKAVLGKPHIIELKNFIRQRPVVIYTHNKEFAQGNEVGNGQPGQSSLPLSTGEGGRGGEVGGNVTIEYSLVINAKEYHHTFTTQATSKEEAVNNLLKNIQFDEIDMLIIHSITQKI